jgi:hypothetical protein
MGNVATAVLVGMWAWMTYRGKDRDRSRALMTLPYVLLELLGAYVFERLEAVPPGQLWTGVANNTLTIGDLTIVTAGADCPFGSAVAARILWPLLLCLPLWIAYWYRETPLPKLWLAYLLLFTLAVFFGMRNQCTQRLAAPHGSDTLHWTHYGDDFIRVCNTDFIQVCNTNSVQVCNTNFVSVCNNTTRTGALATKLQHTAPLALAFCVYVGFLLCPYRIRTCETPTSILLLKTIVAIQACLLLYDFGLAHRIFEFDLYAALFYLTFLRLHVPEPAAEYTLIQRSRTLRHIQ